MRSETMLKTTTPQNNITRMITSAISSIIPSRASFAAASKKPPLASFTRARLATGAAEVAEAFIEEGMGAREEHLAKNAPAVARATCVLLCDCVCIYACRYGCMHAWLYVCMYLGSLCACSLHVCMHACMHACQHVNTQVCMRTCMYACVSPTNNFVRKLLLLGMFTHYL